MESSAIINDNQCTDASSGKKCVYSCDICKRTFKRFHTLNEHKNIHENVKPLKCKFCDKSFRQMSNLYRHRQLHNKNNLNKYSCDICERTFSRLNYLKSHLLSHSIDKNQMCDKCGNTFKHKCDLMRHLRIHDNQKRYKCDECQMAFNDGSSMRRHKKNVHNYEKCNNNASRIKKGLSMESSAESERNINVNSQMNALHSNSYNCNDQSSSLTDAAYINWLIDYVSVCRILPSPLPSHMFEKVVNIHKDIALHLDNRINECTFFDILKTAFEDLHTIILEHLLNKFQKC